MMRRIAALSLFCFAGILQGADKDIRLPQYNSTAGAWPNVTVSPAVNSLMGFSNDKTAGNVTVGTGLTLASGVLSSDGSISNRVFFTSRTCTSDADLSPGSSSFGTNQTTKLQTILNNAQSGPILVFWDGAYSVTGLTIYSNTTIIALNGCGAILRSGANAPLFTNANLSGASITDHDIMIDGGIWNGNGPNQTQPPSTFIPIVKIWGANRVSVRHTRLYTSPSFHFWLANVNYVYFSDNYIYSGTNTPTFYLDGIHLNGPASNLFIRNTSAACNDDAVALNADEGTFVGSPSYGAITDAVIDGVVLLGSAHSQVAQGIRLLSGGSLIDHVTIKHITGSTRNRALEITNAYDQGTIVSAGSGNFGDVIVDGVDATLLGSGGQWLVHIVGGGGNIQLRNIVFKDQTLNVPAVQVGNSAVTATIQRMGIEIEAFNSTSGAPFISFSGPQTVNHVDIEGTLLRPSSNGQPAISVTNTGGIGIFASNLHVGNCTYAFQFSGSGTTPLLATTSSVLLGGTASGFINAASGVTVQFYGGADGTTFSGAGSLIGRTQTQQLSAGTFVGPNNIFDDGNHRVGIGTKSPSEPLHIRTTTSGQTIRSLVETTQSNGYAEEKMLTDAVEVRVGAAGSAAATFGGSAGGYIATMTNHPLYLAANGAATGTVDTSGINLLLGKALAIKAGANGLAGTVTLTAGSGTITSTAIDTSTTINLTRTTASGAATALVVDVTSGSATITGAGTDNGTYNWTAIKRN